jgi:hypothetical protein
LYFGVATSDSFNGHLGYDIFDLTFSLKFGSTGRCYNFHEKNLCVAMVKEEGLSAGQ